MINILLIGGFTLVVMSVIFQFLAGMAGPKTAYTLRWTAKNTFIVGFVVIIIGVVLKFFEPSAEEAKSMKEEAAASQQQKRADDIQKAAEEAAQDASNSQKDTKTVVAEPVSSSSSPQVWVVPSGKYGYYIDQDGVIDKNAVYTPGRYPVREGGSVTLVSSNPEDVVFFEESGDYGMISSYTTDGKNVSVGVVITWSINPRNLARFKGEFGSNYKYTPIVINMSRSAVRDAISKTTWVIGKNDTNRWTFDREPLANHIRQRLQDQTTEHFRGLGFGDESDKVINYGAVSLRTIEIAN